ncbi:hypothetical protein [Jiangella anatolica]|uniref:Uncharacterized protein n=1 Tax=Jiangella anatolica TaxID=2670374 RepID=A0A2W2CNQ9_9ACTN|nr:hypothetical protein [Jiangella anatolica]PZF81863.1 hypothetical protein C1I92_19230 [Jiangella anatolica]
MDQPARAAPSSVSPPTPDSTAAVSASTTVTSSTAPPTRQLSTWTDVESAPETASRQAAAAVPWPPYGSTRSLPSAYTCASARESPLTALNRW